MVKHTIPCPTCPGHVEVIRELEDELGAAQVEGRHSPTCKAAQAEEAYGAALLGLVEAVLAQAGAGDAQRHADDPEAVSASPDTPGSHRLIEQERAH